MKKILLIGLLLVLIVTAGCANHNNKTSTNNNKVNNISLKNNQENTNSNTNSEENENHQMTFVKDCSFVNASEVKAQCGVDVSLQQDDPSIYGPCSLHFEDENGNRLGMIYYQYPSPDDKEIMYNHCLENGEKINDFICADDDGNFYVFADKYSLSFGNEEWTNGNVCSPENLKKLVKEVGEKIYS